MVTRTPACSANKGRSVGASSTQTALTPKHNCCCPWWQHHPASEHTPAQTVHVRQKKSAGTSATYACYVARAAGHKQRRGGGGGEVGSTPPDYPPKISSPATLLLADVLAITWRQKDIKRWSLMFSTEADTLIKGDTEYRGSDFITLSTHTCIRNKRVMTMKWSHPSGLLVRG